MTAEPNQSIDIQFGMPSGPSGVDPENMYCIGMQMPPREGVADEKYCKAKDLGGWIKG